MKIIKDYTDHKIEQLDVCSATYIGDFKISILFSDGSNQVVDFKFFLQNSQHPAINKYFEEERFKDFQIIDGNINWNDYDLIFPIEDLYNGKI